MLQPPAVLLMGAAGSGKTSALTTFLPAGIETFVLCTEPGGSESLVDWTMRKGYDMSRLHWAHAFPASAGWKGIENLINEISLKDYESLAKIKSGIGKSDTRPAAMKMLNLLKDFRCERTGQSYGDVTTWGPDRAFCFDSLSGLSDIAWALTVGHKPTAHQGEWNIAMNFVSDLLRQIISDRHCYFVLTAHIEKELNELTGANQIMVSTLGRKLAPRIPKFFSEVVYVQKRPGPSFTWSTIDATVDLKNRALPISDNLKPDFAQVVDAYLARVKAVGELEFSPKVTTAEAQVAKAS